MALNSTRQETNVALNLCRLPSWNYQEDEECLRIVAKDAEQQQQQEEKRLHIGAEDREAA